MGRPSLRLSIVCANCRREIFGNRKNQRFCNEKCQRAWFSFGGRSIESNRKTSQSLLRFYIEHPELKAKFKKNGQALQKSGLAYRHKVGWKPPEGFAIKVRMGVLRAYAERPEIKEKLRLARLNQILPNKATSIELAMRTALDVLGISYLTNESVLDICQPDIVIPEKKVAVFCDGDYWHTKPDYVIRDARQNEVLTKAGWKVLRFWGHEINTNPKQCADRILEVIA